MFWDYFTYNFEYDYSKWTMPDFLKGLGNDMAWRFEKEILSVKTTIPNVKNLTLEDPIGLGHKGAILVEKVITWLKTIQRGLHALIASKSLIMLRTTHKGGKSIF